MKKLFIFGNWKSNKNTIETMDWLNTFRMNYEQHKIQDNKIVIICAGFTLLPMMREYIVKYNLPLQLAAQDISPFEAGPYTGEVNAAQIKEFAGYVLIGHSERRDNFGETDELSAMKVLSARRGNLIPILCVQGTNTPIAHGAAIIAYEPPGAISTVSKGIPDDPDKVEKVIEQIKIKHENITVIYGGSVNPANVKEFTAKHVIQGVLSGAASLDPLKFFQIVQNA